MRAVFFGVGGPALLAAHFARALEGQAANAKTIEGALPKLDRRPRPARRSVLLGGDQLHLAKVQAGRVLSRLDGVE